MREVQIPSQSGFLQGTLFSVDSALKKPAILLIHGWKSGQDRMFQISEMFCERSGIACLTVDLHGHGKTIGDLNTLSRKDFLDDVVAAYDFLVSQNNIDKERIGVIGSSFGGYLATLLSTQRQLAWIAMRVPADYPDHGFEEPKKINEQPNEDTWRREPRDWSETATLRAVHAFQGKILLIESEHDEIIPHQLILNYKNAVSDPSNLKYVVMKGAPHSLSKHPEFQKEFSEILFNWEKEI